MPERPPRSPREVDPRVQAAVLAWARADELEQAARVLAKERKQLPAELRSVLATEVAEISIESFFLVMQKRSGVQLGRTLELLGVRLPERQAERLSAWFRDQPATARALGVEVADWFQLLGAALERFQAKEGEGPSASERKQMARLLGQGGETFSRPSSSAKDHQTLLDLLTDKKSG